MTRIFIDTSALIALKDSSDQNHAAALDYFSSVCDQSRVRFILSNYIVSEVHAYFCRDPEVALECIERVLREPEFHLVRAGPSDERQALSLLRRFKDKTYSWADAVSFSVMERLGIKTAFAFDRHFRQIGRYRVVP